MAELVDALRSGRSVLMDVEVRVLFWAPTAFPNQSEFARVFATHAVVKEPVVRRVKSSRSTVPLEQEDSSVR